MSLQPFVKWAGGKRQIIDKLLKFKPKKYKHYFEPFVGGGVVFLNLESKHTIINDLNVFPVPDGDTGTNMKLTYSNGLKTIRCAIRSSDLP